MCVVWLCRVCVQETEDYNSHQNQGVSFAQVTQRDGQRCSAAVAFLRPAIKLYGNTTLTVASSVTVTRLIYDPKNPKKVVGVQYKRGQGMCSAVPPSRLTADG